MEKLYPNIYMYQMPLRNSPLRELNVYVITSKDKNLIIDTGFYSDETKERFAEIFNTLELRADNTELFLTHLHSDHTGLASYFDEMGVKIYASRVDGDLLNKAAKEGSNSWDIVYENAIMQGLEEDQLIIEDHPGYKHRSRKPIRFQAVEENDTIAVGDYLFKVVDLRGHSPGMIGLYEEKKHLFFCGDHILARITPNITFWGFEYGDLLGCFIKNLKKVHKMKVDHLFSSHRALVENHRERIDELIEHHEERLQEVRLALHKNNNSSIRDITKKLHWNVKADSWEEFPKAQKWFAAGETHAHLEHLRELGEVEMMTEGRVIYYSLSNLGLEKL